MVTKNNFLKEIKTWGPSFEIQFDIKIQQFTGQIVYLTDGTRRGDGIPQVIAVNNRLEVSSRVNGEILKIYTQFLKINVWYHITISQKQSTKSARKVPEIFQF